MNTKTYTIIGVVVVLVIVGLFFIPKTSSVGSTKYNEFAQCLTDKGVTFYGAFWCPHCQAQKKMFEAAATLLPYVECSTPDGNGRQKICIDKAIEQYPTWEFADGTRHQGEISFVDLAAKSGCTLPSDTEPQAPVDTNTSSAIPVASTTP